MTGDGEARKRWNRANPGEPLSLSANLTNPADGKCYARGTERYSQNGCAPMPGGFFVHAKLYDKKDGRAHQAGKPVETWDYDPMASRPRRTPTAPTAGHGPVQRFGRQVRRSASEDPAPAGPKAVSGHSGRTAPSSGQADRKDQGQERREGLLGKLRGLSGQ